MIHAVEPSPPTAGARPKVVVVGLGPAGAGLGTTTGDADATTPLTSGSVDAEPFYSARIACLIWCGLVAP